MESNINEIFNAVGCLDINRLQRAIPVCDNINCTDSDGYTALVKACATGFKPTDDKLVVDQKDRLRLALVRCLLSNKADVNGCPEHPPLSTFWAAMDNGRVLKQSNLFGYFEELSLLLIAHGVNLNAYESGGAPVLVRMTEAHSIYMDENIKIGYAGILLQGGANINLEVAGHRSVASYAAYKRWMQLLNFYVTHGANAEEILYDGRTITEFINNRPEEIRIARGILNEGLTLIQHGLYAEGSKTIKEAKVYKIKEHEDNIAQIILDDYNNKVPYAVGYVEYNRKKRSPHKKSFVQSSPNKSLQNSDLSWNPDWEGAVKFAVISFIKRSLFG